MLFFFAFFSLRAVNDLFFFALRFRTVLSSRYAQLSTMLSSCIFFSVYIVRLRFIFGTVLNFTELSACTSLSVRYSIPPLCRTVLHCRYGIQFHYFVELYSFFLTSTMRLPRRLYLLEKDTDFFIFGFFIRFSCAY
jgi:hypothetical protein